MELAYPDNLEEKEMVEDPEHLLNTWLDELDSLTGVSPFLYWDIIY